MKKIIIVCLLIFISINVNSQDKKKSLWEFIKGKELKSSITFLPVGTHTKDIDVIDTWYTAYNYKSYEIAAFKNSYGDFSLAALYKRELEVSKKFSVIYGFGAVYGYHGRLQNVSNIPFRKTFLFTGEINPVAGISLDYKIAKKTSLYISLNPTIFLYGFRYII